MRKDIVACSDKCVHLPSEDCVVLSDLHLGSVNPESPYPEMEHEQIDSRIKGIIQEYNPRILVFNGDVFANPKADEKSEMMIEEYSNMVDEIVFTVGNHEEKNGGFPDFVRAEYEVCRNKKIGHFLIHHGHHTPPEKAEVHIIGHTHIQKNGDDILLFGENCYYNSDVVVLPKFSNYVGGSELSNVNTKGHCPLLTDGRSMTAYQVVKEY